MYNVIVGPTVEPVTLAEVKAQLGIQTADTASDALLTRRITEARMIAEDHCQRSLMPQTLEMRWNDFAEEIRLQMPPVVSVLSVKYIDTAGTLQTISADNYVLDTFDPTPFIREAYSYSWPSPRDERNAVRVQYKSGYTPVAVGSAKTITAITAATPGVVTSAAHGYADGDLISLTVAGMTELTGLVFRVYAKTTDTFQLANLQNDGAISTATYSAFISGSAQKVTSTVPPLIKSAILLLVGHDTNFQTRIEAGNFITRIPAAVEQRLDSEKVYFRP